MLQSSFIAAMLQSAFIWLQSSFIAASQMQMHCCYHTHCAQNTNAYANSLRQAKVASCTLREACSFQGHSSKAPGQASAFCVPPAKASATALGKGPLLAVQRVRLPSSAMHVQSASCSVMRLQCFAICQMFCKFTLQRMPSLRSSYFPAVAVLYRS